MCAALPQGRESASLLSHRDSNTTHFLQSRLVPWVDSLPLRGENYREGFLRGKRSLEKTPFRREEEFMTRTIMAVHAHPDDESMSTGGTLALFAKNGARVILVCATAGEEGENHGPRPCEDLGALRLEELRQACKVLGVSELRLLGYRDSGMAGAPSNYHPRAFSHVPLEQVARNIASIIRDVRPDVVITYNERGLYGHPDHVRAHRGTMLALEMARREGPQGEEPWEVPLALCIELPRSRMERIQAILEKKGETLPYPVEVLGTEDARVAIWLDVGPVLEMKLRAIRCHKSQLGPKSLVNRIPEEFLRDALGTECYSVARGIPMFHLFPSGPPKEDP